MYAHLNSKVDVDEWLERLEIPEYAEIFHKEGYRTGEDIENLKDLKEQDLRAMGVSKRGALFLCELHVLLLCNICSAHLQRLRAGIDNLVKPTPCKLTVLLQ